MKIAMIGCGYVGLVTGACFASFGFSVASVDTDEAKIAALKAGGVETFLSLGGVILSPSAPSCQWVAQVYTAVWFALGAGVSSGDIIECRRR